MVMLLVLVSVLVSVLVVALILVLMLVIGMLALVVLVLELVLELVVVLLVLLLRRGSSPTLPSCTRLMPVGGKGSLLSGSVSILEHGLHATLRRRRGIFGRVGREARAIS